MVNRPLKLFVCTSPGLVTAIVKAHGPTLARRAYRDYVGATGDITVDRLHGLPVVDENGVLERMRYGAIADAE